MFLLYMSSHLIQFITSEKPWLHIFVQGSSDQSSNRQHRFATQMKNRYTTNNGTMSTLESNAIPSKMVSNHPNLQVKDKVVAI